MWAFDIQTLRLHQRRDVSSLLWQSNLQCLLAAPHCRVHTILHQVGGATGRINSSHPNLQNLPMHDPRAVMIRAAFNVPAPGYVLVSADYSQVELRVLAALSGDEALQEALKGDVHSSTARILLGKGPQVKLKVSWSVNSSHTAWNCMCCIQSLLQPMT